MISEIEKRKSPESRFLYFDTICRQVANRVPHLREFASSHDVVLFVSGKKSSNGKFLYTECNDVNPKTYFVSTPDEIPAEALKGAKSIGICGATSTPRWLMEEVKERAASIVDNNG